MAVLVSAAACGPHGARVCSAPYLRSVRAKRERTAGRDTEGSLGHPQTPCLEFPTLKNTG